MAKRITVVTLILLLICTFGIWAGGQKEDGGSEAAEGKKAEQITLTVWMWDHPPIEDVVTKIVKPEFEAEHPNITVKYDIPAAQQAEEHKKIVIAAQADALPDVAALGGMFLAEHVHLKTVKPLDSEAFKVFGVDGMEEFGQLFEGGQAIASFGDTFYGVPLSVAAYCMVLNTAHFEEAGLNPDEHPETWLEGDRSLASIGKKLATYDGDTIVREGYGLPTHPTGSLLNFKNAFGSLGGKLLSEDGKTCNLDSPEAVRTVEMYRDLVFKHKISNPGGAGRTGLKREAFQNETASIMSTIWSWYIGVIQQYPEVWKDGKGVKFFPFPQFKDGEPYSEKYGSLWVTTTGTKHSEESWMLQKKFMEHAGDFLSTGLMVPVKGWAESEPARNLMQFDTFREILSYPGGMQLHTNEVGAMWSEAFTKVLLEDAPVKPALEKASRGVEDYLENLPYSPLPKKIR